MILEPDLHFFKPLILPILACVMCMCYVCTGHCVNNIPWPNAAHMVGRDALTEQRFHSKLDHNHSHLYKIVTNLLANVVRRELSFLSRLSASDTLF